MRQIKDSVRLMRPLMMLFGGTFGSALFSLAAQLLLARRLVVADYGRLAAVLAAVNLLSPVAGFGINWFWVQAFGREGYRGFRWVRPSIQLLAVTNMISLVGLAAYFLLSDTIPPNNRAAVIVMAGLMLLGQGAVDIGSTRFQLEEKFGWLAFWQALSQFGRLAVAAVVGFTALKSLQAVLTGYALVGFLLLVCGVYIMRKFANSGLNLVGHARDEGQGDAPANPSLATTAKLSFPFAFITIFYLIYFQSVILLVAAFIGPESTAILSAALLILSAIQLVPNIIFTKFLIGRICRWAEHDRDSFEAILHISVVSMVVLGVGTMLALIVVAPIAVNLIFGAKYARTIQILIWLTPTIPLRFVQSAYSAMLVSEANVRRRVKYAGISAFCSLALNLALLPTLGLAGAVIASIASEAVLLVLNGWGVARHLDGVRLSSSFSPSELRAAARRILLPDVVGEPL